MTHAQLISGETQYTVTSAQPDNDLSTDSIPSKPRDNDIDKSEYVVDRIVTYMREGGELRNFLIVWTQAKALRNRAGTHTPTIYHLLLEMPLQQV